MRIAERDRVSGDNQQQSDTAVSDVSYENVQTSEATLARTWDGRVVALERGHLAVAAAAVVPDARPSGCDKGVVVMRVAPRHRGQDPLGGSPLGRTLPAVRG